MEFCANCGSNTPGRFCRKCGLANSPAINSDVGFIPTNVASALCYLLWFATGIFFLAFGPYRRNLAIRFHAYQSIFSFVGLFVIDIVLDIAFIGTPHVFHMFFTLFKLSCWVLWIYLMYSAWRGKRVKLPIVGNMAERRA